ncbi:MAG: DegT/DnrJ/EryC1/StrS family aminotransferase [Bryobacteraceae bacterium]|nr:DegT/DnrJ/EryC1/StrS family aminotransferase [Bryobacteraceae bacterium]
MANSGAYSTAAAPVKLNDFERQWAETGGAVLDAVREVGESGWYILGRQVSAFEAGLSEFWGLPHAVGVASGLDAIEIGLRVCGCKPGDKVIVPPVSAFATVLAVIRLGAVPVFVDCDSYGLADLDLVEKAMEADPAIRYFVPVHLYGHCLDMARMERLKARFGAVIVEDCAQSIGARHNGITCGTVGDCAATSFYPTKNLGALGDGGALLTRSPEHAAAARCLRDYGQASKYRHEQLGYNSRLDELHAAVMLRAFLPRLSEWTSARRTIAAEYLQGIRNPLIQPLGIPAGSDSCWHLFPVRVDPARKREFMDHLKGQSVGSAEHYPSAMLDQPAMSQARYEVWGDCGRARELCASEVSLPIHPYLTSEERARVVDACNSWK